MFILKKSSTQDFVVLNITDIQLTDEAWSECNNNVKITTHTIKELVDRVKPNLITISGDLAYADHKKAYEALADFLDNFEIPWAPVWGNHDNQGTPEFIDQVANDYLKHRYCLYEKGDPVLGNGNYVIAIEEDGKVVEGFILMDSHDRECTYIDEAGNEHDVWAKLSSEQLEWYRNQVKMLSELGCEDTTIIMHIPMYAYRQAINEALCKGISHDSLTEEMFASGECWTEDYKDSVGVAFEGVGSHPHEDGVFDVVKELRSTKNVIVGHDHANDWMINYQGVRLIYALKTGTGSYWQPGMNGGTVICINSNGVVDIHHEYVDISSFLAE